MHPFLNVAQAIKRYKPVLTSSFVSAFIAILNIIGERKIISVKIFLR